MRSLLLPCLALLIACGTENSGVTDHPGGGSGAGGSAGASGSSAIGGGGGSPTGGATSIAGQSGTSGSGGANPASGGAGSGGNSGSGGEPGSGGSAGSGGISSGGVSGAGSGGSGGTGPLSDITIWIAGDSTVATSGGTPCPVGWGGQFAPLFSDQVTVTNSAVGGRSVRSWLYDVQDSMVGGECVLALGPNNEPTLQSRWQAMLTGMKPGDYLFIQFGINDGDSTCPRHVGLDAFKTTYGMMAQAAKERGAQPVFVTPVSAIACNGDTPRGTRGSYVTATIEAGETYDVPVIELHQASVELYGSLGFCPIPGGDVSASTTGPVGEFFCNDHTHFDQPGAAQIANLVATAVSSQGLGLAAYLK